MKVVFIGNEKDNYIRGALFYGKVYDVIGDTHALESCYRIRIFHQYTSLNSLVYDKRYFITLKEYRKQKLLKLNEKIIEKNKIIEKF